MHSLKGGLVFGVHYIHHAVEAVLPPEVRRYAIANRRKVEREEHERTRRLLGLNFMVAGVWYEGRETVIRQHVHEDDVVYLVREPANSHSHNAVQVRLQNWLMIGYIPEDYAFDAAALLDQGNVYSARITKVLREARVPIPMVQADIHRPDCGLPVMFIPVDVWGRTLPTSPMSVPPMVQETHDQRVVAIRINLPARRPTKKWWEFWK